jgi:hypothetical protein
MNFCTLTPIPSRDNCLTLSPASTLAKLSNSKLDDISHQVNKLSFQSEDEETEKILSWISALSFRARQADVREGVQPGTCLWFLQHDKFRTWVNGNSRTIWCPGIRTSLSHSTC